MLPPPQHDSVVHNLGSTVCSQQADGDKESCRIWCYFGLGNRIFIPWTLLPWLQPDSSGSYTLPSVEHFAWPPWNPCCLTDPLCWEVLFSAESMLGWDGINLAHWCCGAIVVEIRKMVSLPRAPPCQVAKLCTSQEPPQHHSSAATRSPVRPALEGGSTFKQGHGAAFLCQNACCHSPPAFLTRQCSSADTTQSATFSINMWSYTQTYHINDFLHFCEHKLIW